MDPWNWQRATSLKSTVLSTHLSRRIGETAGIILSAASKLASTLG